MKIVICGSMTSYPKMVEVKSTLEKMGHVVILPDPAKNSHLKEIVDNKYEDTFRLKRKYDYIRKHFCNIVTSDCILITNWDKKGIKNYVGGNAFLEMGFAHILNKPIFLLHPIPTIDYYYHEMMAMNPKIFPFPSPQQ